MYNPDLSLAELEQLNIVPDNSSLLKKDDYKNIQAVRDAFSDSEGNFNEKEFDGFYDGALALYNKYANGEYEKKIPILHEYLDSKWDRPLEQPVADTNPTFDLKDKSLLTASYTGDSALNAISVGCKDVTIAYPRPIDKYYQYLKYAGILTLTRDEYLEFFSMYKK